MAIKGLFGCHMNPGFPSKSLGFGIYNPEFGLRMECSDGLV